MIVTFSVLKVAQWLLSSWKQILLCTENFEVFLTDNKVSYTSKSPNSSNAYAMKVECLQTIFCVTKAWRKWKKRKVRGTKTGFEAEWNRLQAVFLFQFLSGCLCQQCWVLKVAYDFGCPVLLASKLITYKKWFVSRTEQKKISLWSLYYYKAIMKEGCIFWKYSRNLGISQIILLCVSHEIIFSKHNKYDSLTPSWI